MVVALLTAITAVLIVLYSSWIFLFLLPTKKKTSSFSRPLSIIIPAYNEEKNIEATIRSALDAEYPEKEIIVVNDGSTDSTEKIVRKIASKNKCVKLLKGRHEGKGKAVNLGIKHSKYDFAVVLDADTEIEKGALKHLIKPFSDKTVGAVSTVLRVKKSGSILNWFQQFEYAINTSWRYVVDKIGGSCIVPGFCAFRKSAFLSVGGFRGDSAVEDYDICMYLNKAGYKIKMASNAVCYTKVPSTFFSLVKQRIRWNRGTLQVLRKHKDIFLSKSAVGLYSIPNQLYWFIHSFVYLPLVIYQIGEGYYKYFFLQGDVLSANVLAYFVKWFTTYGMADFIYKVVLGVYPSSLINVLTITVFFLSYSFAVFALFKFYRKLNFEVVFSLVFFFPYTLSILWVYIYSTVYEIFSLNRGEKWEKGV